MELAEQVGLRRVPEAVAVAEDCPLFVCGLRRSRLILPSRLLASLNPAERRQVILHELAHVKRWDLVWGWPVEIGRIVYFFHPLVYWVAYQLRLERELACDQLAMARSGHPPADYAQTLVQVVSHASEPAAVQAAAISAGLTGSQPSDRLGSGAKPPHDHFDELRRME
jgi:beta-lactamase regulating signal transducer with metallopeptidase domain